MEVIFRVRVSLVVFTVLTQRLVNASHFRGGTISWRPVNSTQVEFYWKMGWVYGRGPGCNVNTIGQYVDNGRVRQNIECTRGCTGSKKVSTSGYNCIAASQAEKWEQGERKITKTFPDAKEYSVAFKGQAWMSLAGGKGQGAWNVETTLDLRQRDDIGGINSSPVTLSKTLYSFQLGCPATLRLPVKDPDGDTIRCRWAVGRECDTVCNALPMAHIDEETCTINFLPSRQNGYVKDGFYAVAVTIEDFPRHTTYLDGNVTKTPLDALSTVPLQFLIQTPEYPGPCDAQPQFVSPTPADKDFVIVTVGSALDLSLFADNGNKTTVPINEIQVIGPLALHHSALQTDSGRTNTFYVTLTWNTTRADMGEEIVCANPTDVDGKSGNSRCFTINIQEDYCTSRPCENGGNCTNIYNDYHCACPHGYAGKNCHSVDNCLSSPCKNGYTCVDEVNGFICVGGMTSTSPGPVIDFCQLTPCQNGGSCDNIPGDFNCSCSQGFKGKTCQDIETCLQPPCVNTTTPPPPGMTGPTINMTSYSSGGTSAVPAATTTVPAIDFCQIGPCQNGGTCQNVMGSYTCACRPGFAGRNCGDNDDCLPSPCNKGYRCDDRLGGYVCRCNSSNNGKPLLDIDRCKNQPCQNGGVCTTECGDYACACATGYIGRNCQDIDACSSSPCQKGSVCVDQAGGYICVCDAGKFNNSTKQGYAHCSSSPCDNGGVCVDQANGYRCLCPGGWGGANCQESSGPSVGTTVLYGKGTGGYPCTKHGGNRYVDPLGMSETLANILIGFFGFLLGLACGLLLYFCISRCCDRDEESKRSASMSRVDAWAKEAFPARNAPLNHVKSKGW